MSDDGQSYREIWSESGLEPGDKQSLTQMELIQSIYTPDCSPEESRDLEPVKIDAVDMEGNVRGEHLVGWRLKA